MCADTLTLLSTLPTGHQRHRAEAMRVERGWSMTVLEQKHGSQAALARYLRHEQRAAGDTRKIRIARESDVGTRIVDDQRLSRTFGIIECRQRQQPFPACLAHRHRYLICRRHNHPPLAVRAAQHQHFRRAGKRGDDFGDAGCQTVPLARP
jgi:hypothetical protein